jgi:hypothetical protein
LIILLEFLPGIALLLLVDNPNFVSAEKMGQDFELQEAEEDRLLDALSLLEIHGDLARRCIVDARTAFTRLFPYFFPKQKQPDTFSELAKHFIPEENLGLTFRQENLKVGVEGTIALVAESQQNVDWAKAGETKGIQKEKWKSLIKAAKLHSKKILSSSATNQLLPPVSPSRRSSRPNHSSICSLLLDVDILMMCDCFC